MKRATTILTIFLTVFAISPLYGQKKLESLVSDFTLRSEQYTRETIYTQTNKDIYETGEDLWFKTYHLSADDLTLFPHSQTLYLQVSSENDSIIWQEKYPIINGISEGHIYIDKNLKAGNYFIETYTSNSFYSDSSSFTSLRKIKVVENISNESTAEANTANEDNIRFETYPESGSLIHGLPSRLAFKATDGRGNPMNVSGSLYENDSLIATFQSMHDGMGAIHFIPMADKAYQVRLSTGQSYSLPEIHRQGITLNLTRQNQEFLEFTIRQNAKLEPQKIYLTGQMRGTPYCGAEINLHDSIAVKIPLKEFTGQGIAEFTLFSQDGMPLAERLAYVNPHKKLYITAETDEKRYMAKNKASLKIKVSDENGNPVSAHLGVSVFDKAYADQAYPVNIQTHSMLSSQIRGRIHNPHYYFDVKNANRNEVIDLLLMTQGWRRYVWKYDNDRYTGDKVLGDDINGIQKIKNKKLQGSSQVVQISGATGDVKFVYTDSTGYFSIQSDMLNDLRGGYLYLKPMLSKEFGPQLTVNDPYTTINQLRKQKTYYYPFTDPDRIKADSIDREPLINQFGDVMLDEVIITGKSSRPIRDKFMGRLDSLAQKDFGPYVCEHGHLENYMEGYTVHHDPRYCPCPNEPKEKNPPVIGKAYRLIKPKYLENCKSRTGCCFIVESAITVIYQGPLYNEEELLKKNGYSRTKGYYAKREFYIPDDIEMLSSLPDVRNALYWNPTVITDEKGEAEIPFHCSDINSDFIARLEGIGGEGLLGVGECEFRVIKYSPN